jgi:cytochrome c5
MLRGYIPTLLLLTTLAGAMLTGIVRAGDQPTAASAGPAKSGKDIWKGTCQVCHATGLLGAPKIGDKVAWAPRIAKGMDILKDHALHGFNEMPAKGANMALTDEDVVKALEYMVGQSK